MTWVIQFTGSCPCWIAAPPATSTLGTATLGITYQATRAQRFDTEEAAIRELLRLRLPKDWMVVRG